MAAKSTHSSGRFRPFEDLQAQLLRKSITLPSPSDTRSGPVRSRDMSPPSKPSFLRQTACSSTRVRRGARTAPRTRSDGDLFREAMAGVRPLQGQRSKVAPLDRLDESSPLPDTDREEESRILSQLNRLIENGDGFIVENTPEYKEWTGFNVNPWITQRLHRGEFTIQAYIDLHGLDVHQAKSAFETFLREALVTSKHAVLIVHGRGLSSPYEPVLKYKVCEWLTSSRWNKWVVAFSSARLCDGGTGATYVLLRKHPLPKRFRKKSAQNRLDK
jgi:DNA-nicking Smr family endonuclease